MKLDELDSYYFCTPKLEKIRIKYFSTFKEMLGSENFFNNKKLSSDAHWKKLTDMADKLIEYIFSNKKIKKDFTTAYKTDDDSILGELILQSIVVDVAIQSKLKMNIFKDKRSILYFDNTYPNNISIYKNKRKSRNMFEYIAFFEDFKKILDSIPPEELFGKEFVEEMEQKLKDLKNNQNPKNKKYNTICGVKW